MLHESTQQLIRKLYELTQASALAWTEGEGACSRLETEGYVVEIGAEPALLRLLRGDGRELDRVEADELAAVAWPSGDGSYATRVADMARRAHRVARGAEQAIAQILTALSSPARAETSARPPELATPAPFGAIAGFDTSTPAAPEADAATPEAEAAAPEAEAAAPEAEAEPTRPAEPAQPVEAPAAAAPTPAPTVAPRPPVFASLSARSVQTVESALPSDLPRLAPPAPQPPPAPPMRSGPDIYKPWS